MFTLPEQVKIVEVGPRDGFQNIKQYIATETKLSIIETMVAAGVTSMEVTSFVHPKAIPQMADAAQVAETVASKYQNTAFKPIALVPNLTGGKKAYSTGIREVSYVISASEKHNLENINRTHIQSLEDLSNIVKELPDLKVRLDVATSFGCPFLGRVDDGLVTNLIQEAVKLGIKTVVLCDTIGVADPLLVYNLASKVKTTFSNVEVGLHLHDTRGMALANTLAGLEAGITIFEASVGGLGGCPFAPGAAGNAATEDLINMFHAMGIKTDIDLSKYIEATRIVREKVQDVLTSRMAYACSYKHI
ncbi:hydroxymethylglutaryl-CoA lyase [Sporomusa malonica]|uniref:Hydroxymethylglutaryl-CoA lyase n=1 Tax=Sporomusa malonica TaxID=112901 RepID=A0A1W2D6Y4_9FIRM|nr:hydroxymethylglutaryl-CoA lyase [Sporomusa malonica]